ncbi:hypothetical protein BJ742DRAFT_672482, partial [Cladochytrium replicatum]
WKDVRVGDFVFLSNDEPIPADILILSTSEPECLAYVETKNLDGETNLKIRKGVLETSYIKKPADCLDLKFIVETEPPSSSLLSFSATVIMSQKEFQKLFAGSNNIQIPVGITAMLLRGCVLRNVEWVIGMVLFTGNDSKIILNSGKPPTKRSILERKMNMQVLGNLFLLLILCLITSIGNSLWEVNAVRTKPQWLDSSYQDSPRNPYWNFFLGFWSALITFQNIVPISLYISVEIVRTSHAYFIHCDGAIYDDDCNQPCVPRAWNLSDDLGQIDYIFSDKTGTLTRNIMEFKKCSIQGSVFGGGPAEENERYIAHRKKKIFVLKKQARLADIARSLCSVVKSHIERIAHIPTGSFYDHQLNLELRNLSPKHSDKIFLHEFFLLLATCHSVLVSGSIDPASSKIISPSHYNNIKYKAQSPDEAALVAAAKDVGFVFLLRDTSTVWVDILGEIQKFTLLHVLEFNSTRKRMSIILRKPSGQLFLYCKGADSVIYERLHDGQEDLKEETGIHLEEFAEEAGYRTLCLASRQLDEIEYQFWLKEYLEACVSLTERELEMDRVASKIEQGLTLLGATAIEDKLQDGVPECISTLSAAGINIWMLTGDKLETAINIGFSCNLLTTEMNLILIKGSSSVNEGPVPDGNSGASTFKQMNDALQLFWGHSFHYDEKLADSASTVEQPQDVLGAKEKFALIIDGNALQEALIGDSQKIFISLASKCSVVLCCRVSPLQKAEVVKLVNRYCNATSLAIGDGANDVSMIQAAHIGIGIAGHEGLQAAMSSDYVISQFKYLGRLLLVHGQWSFLRTLNTILSFFFKNIIWVMGLFWFQIFCGYSADIIYDFSYLLLYNLFFTSLPVVALGVFDQFLTDHYLLYIPPLYRSQKSLSPNKRCFLFVIEAVYQSAICTFFPILMCSEDVISPDGRVSGKFELGVLIAINSILNANFFVFMSSSSWNYLNVGAILISNSAVFIWTAIYSLVPASGIAYTGLFVIMNSQAYLCIILVCLLCHLPRFTMYYCIRSWKPSDIHVVQEVQNFGIDVTTSWTKARTNTATNSSKGKVSPDIDLDEANMDIAKSENYDCESPKSFHERLSVYNLHSRSRQISVSSRAPSRFFNDNASQLNYQRSSVWQSGFISLSPSVKDKSTRTEGQLTIMNTGKVVRNRGYSFSQSEGAKDIIQSATKY